MDGIVGGVPASGPSGWQGGEVFSEVQRWNRIEADGQMKTPWCITLFLPLGWRWALRFGTMLPLPVPQVEIAFVAAGRLSCCPPAGGLFHAVISRLECLSLP